ncbi:MAG: inositol monophosphatase family protein [Polyangiaceae bacterium]
MSNHSDARRAMIRAAELAGEGLVRDFARLATLPVSEKGPSDFVSSADIDAQRRITDELSAKFPGYGFLLEEEASLPAATVDARFIIDPLDGTTNFLRGIPHFSVSIALEVAGEIVVGVVLNPVQPELFWAEKNGGAWLGERRLRVSPPSTLARTVVGTGIPHLGRPDHAHFLGSIAKMMPEIGGIRRLGSAALDLAYVAAGRYDMFWERGLSPWDVAAAQLLVTEAGGIVTKSNGAPMGIEDRDVLASNGAALHTKAIAWLAS